MTESTLETDFPPARDLGKPALFAWIPANSWAANHLSVPKPEATPFRETMSFLDGSLKRAMDILLVLLSAPLAAILVSLAAVGIKLSSRGPVFFVQERLGRNGVTFPCYKLRTMVEGAEQGTPQWATKSDPRVTPVGRFLRRSRLDELPQL